MKKVFISFFLEIVQNFDAYLNNLSNYRNMERIIFENFNIRHSNQNCN